MNRVFVVQKQMRFDRDVGDYVPKFDLSPAREYGELHYLLSPSAAPFSPESILAELHERLADFGDSDYLLLVGNPCLIGFATAIASDYNDGRINLLQWNGKERRYLPVSADLFS